MPPLSAVGISGLQAGEDVNRFFRALWALRVGPWITLASYPPPSLRLLVI